MRRGRPPVIKPWKITITGRHGRELVVFAKTREEAEDMARFMVKQSFPFSSFTVKRYWGRLDERRVGVEKVRERRVLPG